MRGQPRGASVSMPRYAAKTDLSQRNIVASLEQARVRVWIIGRPCDLLCQFYCARHGIWCWQPLEVKTPTKRGRPPTRYDQEQQQEFLELTNTPVVTTFEEAWTVLNTRHHLGQKPV